MLSTLQASPKKFMKRSINLLMAEFHRAAAKCKTGRPSSRLLPLAHLCSQKRAIKSMMSSVQNISNSATPHRMVSRRISPLARTSRTLKIQEVTNSTARVLGLQAEIPVSTPPRELVILIWMHRHLAKLVQRSKIEELLWQQTPTRRLHLWLTARPTFN